MQSSPLVISLANKGVVMWFLSNLNATLLTVAADLCERTRQYILGSAVYTWLHLLPLGFPPHSAAFLLFNKYDSCPGVGDADVMSQACSIVSREGSSHSSVGPVGDKQTDFSSPPLPSGALLRIHLLQFLALPSYSDASSLRQ